MKKYIIFLIMLSMLPGQTRKAEVAGQFYTADGQKLKAEIERYLTWEKVVSDDKPIGLIIPHAGYVYSGQVAAAGYKQIENHQYDAVIIMAPDHRVGFDFISIYEGEFYETPLGKIPVDRDLADQLVTPNQDIRYSLLGHEKKDIFSMGEHALEVQLPFLQTLLDPLKIVPVIIGTQDFQKIETLGKKLQALRQEKDLLIVASSDLSHFHAYEDCKTIDSRLVLAVEKKDPKSFFRELAGHQIEACGGNCIAALMIAGGPGRNVKILKYANSGDVKGGDKSRVVGYLSAAFYERKENKMDDHLLNLEEQKLMLELAEESVKAFVNGKKPKMPENLPAITLEKRGAFVTLHKKGQLRGCIGYILPLKPLAETIIEMAEAASLRDPRFNPVKPSELEDIDVEVSVLTVPYVIDDVSEIEVGKHGIIIRKGYYQGLLLPQVATEYGWDRTTFLEHTCNKAGLHPDAWKEKGTEIKIFSAQVFNRETWQVR
ncbi:MAG: AmmeMemoRadiSam system protein B [Candidatus Marinimicrobia bacterium]|nr:AmmeMemoRadiSam system protein B [Candidatus Neomarinimicrobiota bacterium]